MIDEQTMLDLEEIWTRIDRLENVVVCQAREIDGLKELLKSLRNPVDRQASGQQQRPLTYQPTSSSTYQMSSSVHPETAIPPATFTTLEPARKLAMPTLPNGTSFASRPTSLYPNGYDDISTTRNEDAHKLSKNTTRKQSLVEHDYTCASSNERNLIDSNVRKKVRQEQSLTISTGPSVTGPATSTSGRPTTPSTEPAEKQSIKKDNNFRWPPYYYVTFHSVNNKITHKVQSTGYDPVTGEVRTTSAPVCVEESEKREEIGTRSRIGRNPQFRPFG